MATDPSSNENLSSSSQSESDADLDDVLLADFECQDENKQRDGKKDLSENDRDGADSGEKSESKETDICEKVKNSKEKQVESSKVGESDDKEADAGTMETESCTIDNKGLISEEARLKVKLPSEEEDRQECDSNGKSDDKTASKADSEMPLSDLAMDAMAAAICDDTEGNQEGPNVYQVKWINFKSKEVPIITQNENGPCPLLAIMNVLLVKGKVRLTIGTEIITAEQLMTHLGECILENAPKNSPEAIVLNYEQNMHDAMAVIHKLQTGLDVNVKFTGVRDFEYTPECIIFDLLVISLYHGWLVDPQDQKTVDAVGTCSYNQLVEKIITNRTSDKESLVTEALLAEAFLDKTASQLTYHGLCELSACVKEDELCVFFRNNHFSTMYRHKNELFLLVTDQGFLNESNVVWETLGNVEGDGYFVDANFHTYTKPAPSSEPVIPSDVHVGTEEQVDHDYLLAMSLQQEQQITDPELAWEQSKQQQQQMQLSDQELAARLQAEEDERAAQAAAEQRNQGQGQGQRSPRSGAVPQQQQGQSNRRSRERERDRDRDRERDKSKDNRLLDEAALQDLLYLSIQRMNKIRILRSAVLYNLRETNVMLQC
ncbi:hypothetical protein FSP39_008212 [Pinctada imbricata]|uniref:Ubiquitin carboxyl-terminal hydrolase n=1 Tax=Pinctada imbricata TaxID=66713 RepID=A0AA88YID8_PINIB|nr:hypothetical protein FSP39_008212 [Pinctada imbricata]